jgi:hypothetical protein
MDGEFHYMSEIGKALRDKKLVGKNASSVKLLKRLSPDFEVTAVGWGITGLFWHECVRWSLPKLTFVSPGIVAESRSSRYFPCIALNRVIYD